MEANIISNYTICTSYRYVEEITKEKFEDYLRGSNIRSKKDLEYEIKEYFDYNGIRANPNDIKKLSNYTDDDSFNIENINEIVEYFSYLIIKPQNNSCPECNRRNDEHFQYCPNCGTKL